MSAYFDPSLWRMAEVTYAVVAVLWVRAIALDGRPGVVR